MAADEKEKDDGFLLLQKAGRKTFPGGIKDPDQSSVMTQHEVRGHHQIGTTRQGEKNARRRREQRGEEEEGESVAKLHQYTDVTNLQKKSESEPMTDPPPLVPTRTSRSLFPSFRCHDYLTPPQRRRYFCIWGCLDTWDSSQCYDEKEKSALFSFLRTRKINSSVRNDAVTLSELKGAACGKGGNTQHKL